MSFIVFGHKLLTDVNRAGPDELRVERIRCWSFVSGVRQEKSAAVTASWEMQDVSNIDFTLLSCFTDNDSKLP